MAPAINKEIAWNHQIYLCAGFHGRVVPSYGRQCAKQGTQRSVIAEKLLSAAIRDLDREGPSGPCGIQSRS